MENLYPNPNIYLSLYFIQPIFTATNTDVTDVVAVYIWSSTSPVSHQHNIRF